jgi:antitoxin (DNA-binding transcriptional repressor) of toxin-antitoxin stability system
MKKLSVTIAARKLGSCVDRVYRRHESFELLKNGQPQARLVPIETASCDSHQFADNLDSARLTKKERNAWVSDLRKGRKRIKPLTNPWA